jgi:hypothetical protein
MIASYITVASPFLPLTRSTQALREHLIYKSIASLRPSRDLLLHLWRKIMAIKNVLKLTDCRAEKNTAMERKHHEHCS